jgi:hypothetical protein
LRASRFALKDANQALTCLRSGHFNGAIVLTPETLREAPDATD